MLPKERMILALAHREADRVPVGELASDFEMTDRVLGRPTFYRSKWREWVAEWDGRRDEVAASYGRDICDLAEAFGWDFLVVPLVPARRASYGWPEMLGQYTWRDASGKVWEYTAESGGHAMLIQAPPLTVDDIVVPDKFEADESRLEAVDYAVKRMGGTHLVVGRIPEISFPWRETVGMEEFLMRMIFEPEFVRKAVARSIKEQVAYTEAMCDLGVDAIVECSDYCDNRGPMMGPQFFRQFILPAMQAVGEVCRARGKYFIKHTDGNTWSILDDLIAAGVQAWQGIQPSIGMDLKLLKEKYAGKLCLFGGVDNDTLIAGTPAEVRQQVGYAIRHAGPGGGLAIACGNTLQVGVLYENYMAQLQAAQDFGAYPIAIQ